MKVSLKDYLRLLESRVDILERAVLVLDRQQGSASGEAASSADAGTSAHAGVGMPAVAEAEHIRLPEDLIKNLAGALRYIADGLPGNAADYANGVLIRHGLRHRS